MSQQGMSIGAIAKRHEQEEEMLADGCDEDVLDVVQAHADRGELLRAVAEMRKAHPGTAQALAIGTRVRAKRDPTRDLLLNDMGRWFRVALSGKVGVIRTINGAGDLPFEVEHNGDFSWWEASELTPEQRPRVGPWVGSWKGQAWEARHHATGGVVGEVWPKSETLWGWFARRPYAEPVQGEARTTAEARASVDAVLREWADIDAGAP